MLILGFNSNEHDSSAAVVDGDGNLIAAVEEERFSRTKKESRWPAESIRYCLRAAGADAEDLTGIATGWSPKRFFLGRLLRSHLFDYPVRPRIFLLNANRFYHLICARRRFLRDIGPISRRCSWRYYPHHYAHAASAYFASPFDDAAFITIDGRGERQSLTWGVGEGARLKTFGAFFFPNSIGKLYSAVCRFLGFTSAEKDGTVMALAALGEPRFVNQFKELISWREGPGLGRLRLNTKFFDLQECALPAPPLAALLGISARSKDDPLNQAHYDIAATLQHVTQEILVRLTTRLREISGKRHLVMAGGVALNTVANGVIVERSGFDHVFIQPASHDGGTSLGAALLLAARNKANKPSWSMRSAAVGPSFDDNAIRDAFARSHQVHVTKCEDVAFEAAIRIAKGQVIAWFQGPLEFGPRALGQRSLLADPRNPTVKQRLNALKGREQFRPFAIAILSDEAQSWLQRGTNSPFMLLVDYLRPELAARVPSASHVDHTVRVQTVSRDDNPLFYRVIAAFHHLTSVPMVINTSLNIRGEPLACTPSDAIRVLLESPIDSLLMGSYLLTKSPTHLGVKRKFTPQMVVIAGSCDVGNCITLATPTLVIGRDPGAAMQLLDPRVSRHHLRISFDNTKSCYIAEDLGSEAGTHLRGVLISGQVELQDGDQLMLGNTTLLFRLVESAPRRRNRKKHSKSRSAGRTK